MHKIALGAIATLVALVGLSTSAAASSPVLAAGNFVFLTDIQIPSKMTGGNLFLSETATIQYFGGLTGIATDTDTFVVHADGSFEGQGIEVCTSCTLGSRTGSYKSVFVFRGSGNTFTGSLTFTGSNGGLAGLHGTGTFAGNVATNVNTYAYHFTFSP